MGQLADALRRQFKTPQEALKALGLDASLLEKEKTMTVKLSPRAVVARGALMMYLRPRLAADAQIDLGPILADVTARNFADRRPAIVAALKKATSGKLAADADVEDVDEVLDAVEEFKDDVVDKAEELKEDILGEAGGGGDPDDVNQDSPEMLAKVLEFLKGKLSPEDMNALTEMIGSEEQITETPEEKAAREAADAESHNVSEEDKINRAVDAALKRRGYVTRAAMDEAIKTKVGEVQVSERQRAGAVLEAVRVVRPFVGELALDASLDTAEKIYAKALTASGVKNVDKIHPSAYRTILEMQPRLSRRPVHIAEDGAVGGVKSLEEMFPNAARTGAI